MSAGLLLFPLTVVVGAFVLLFATTVFERLILLPTDPRLPLGANAHDRGGVVATSKRATNHAQLAGCMNTKSALTSRGSRTKEEGAPWASS